MMPPTSATARAIQALLLAGKSRKEIASEVHLSVAGVRYHTSAILRANGVHSTRELIMKARPAESQPSARELGELALAELKSLSLHLRAELRDTRTEVAELRQAMLGGIADLRRIAAEHPSPAAAGDALQRARRLEESAGHLREEEQGRLAREFLAPKRRSA